MKTAQRRGPGRRTTGKALAIAFICTLGACEAADPGEGADPGSDADVQPTQTGTTMLGTPLRDPGWSPEVRAMLEKDLEIAEAVMEVAPEREDSHIWLGRRLGYLARWPEAIEVFDRALEQFPDSYKLLRFRGRHLVRYRQFERAIADYRRAAELIEDVPDSFEPDGIINPRNQFLGTYKSNIYYYLGQASWAVGDFETTLREMERSMNEPLVQHDDQRIVTSFWRYLALRKLGRHEEARFAVHDIPSDLELVENFTYYKGVLHFQGTLSEDELLPEADAIIKFSIAMEHHFAGRQDRAMELWLEAVEESAQGFWPAEAELLRGGYGGD